MSRRTPYRQAPSVEFHLLGRVHFDDCLALQDRLLYEVGGRDDGQIRVLLCEHHPLISVGRGGSRSHIHLTAQELRARQLAVCWVSRGGGCIYHLPGQLAIYALVPLAWYGWTAGEYMRRLHRVLLGVVTQLGFRGHARPEQYGVWGRSGQLAACGVAVRYNVTCHGAFLNVNPAMDLVRLVDVTAPSVGQPLRASTMSCLVAEFGRPVKMTMVRAAVVEQMTRVFGCSRYHVHSGHPLLSSSRRLGREHDVRAS